MEPRNAQWWIIAGTDGVTAEYLYTRCPCCGQPQRRQRVMRIDKAVYDEWQAILKRKTWWRNGWLITAVWLTSVATWIWLLYTGTLLWLLNLQMQHDDPVTRIETIHLVVLGVSFALFLLGPLLVFLYREIRDEIENRRRSRELLARVGIPQNVVKTSQHPGNWTDWVKYVIAPRDVNNSLELQT